MNCIANCMHENFVQNFYFAGHLKNFVFASPVRPGSHFLLPRFFGSSSAQLTSYSLPSYVLSVLTLKTNHHRYYNMEATNINNTLVRVSSSRWKDNRCIHVNRSKYLEFQRRGGRTIAAFTSTALSFTDFAYELNNLLISWTEVTK